MSEHEWRVEVMEWMKLANEAAANERALRLELAEARKVIERLSSTESFVGYAFDANRQHAPLIEEMKLRRGLAREFLKRGNS